MATISTWIPWQPGDDPVDRAWRWIRLLGLLYLAVCGVVIMKLSGWPGGALPEVRVPDAVGLSRDAAFATMQRLGLHPHIQEGERSDGYSQDTVMRQSLTPGMSVREGRGIYLLVCPGPLHVILPDLRRLDSAQAAGAIARLGLQPSIAANVPSADVPFDSVVEQAPGPGVRVEYGSPVALVLSNGPPDTAAPDEADPSIQGAVSPADDPGLPDPTAALPQTPSVIPLGGGPDSTDLSSDPDSPASSTTDVNLDPNSRELPGVRHPQPTQPAYSVSPAYTDPSPAPRPVILPSGPVAPAAAISGGVRPAP